MRPHDPGQGAQIESSYHLKERPGHPAFMPRVFLTIVRTEGGQVEIREILLVALTFPVVPPPTPVWVKSRALCVP